MLPYHMKFWLGFSLVPLFSQETGFSSLLLLRCSAFCKLQGEMFAHQFFFALGTHFPWGKRTNAKLKTFISACPTKGPPRYQRENEGEELHCFHFAYKTFGLILCLGTVLILWGLVQAGFSIQSTFYCILLLLSYNLYETLILYNLYKIIYLKRLPYKENK